MSLILLHSVITHILDSISVLSGKGFTESNFVQLKMSSTSITSGDYLYEQNRVWYILFHVLKNK